MKVYKIRNKTTKQFESFGYNGRASWRNKPTFHIDEIKDKDNYELVVYELVETKVEPLV